MDSMEYAVIIEGGQDGFSAYVPDLPGCVAAAATRSSVEKLIREAIALHIGLLRDRGEAVPGPTTSSLQVRIS